MANTKITADNLDTLTTLTVDDITIDGSTISDAGDLTLDIGGDLTIDVDGADIKFADGGTEFADHFKDGNDYKIQTTISNGDFIIVGNDGGSAINAVQFDMSDAGKALFNAGATFGGNCTINTDTNSSLSIKDGGANAIQILAASGDELYIGANDAYKLRFKTDGNIVMDNGGNVGIGTSSPSNPLHLVAADGTLAVFTNNSDADFQFKTASAVAMITPSTGTLAFGTSNTERMRIDSSGNVGVGTITTDPYSLGATGKTFSINSSNASTGALLNIESDDTNRGYLFGNLSNVVLSAVPAIPLVFKTTDTERMRIDSSGLVGIGRTPSSSTGSMLQVEGNDGIAMRRPSQTNNFTLRPNASTDGIRFTQEGAGDRMTIDASGKLGVGTTPTHTLHAPTARLGEEKWLNSVSAYYISSGTINRNLTINLNGSAEYYIIIYLVGLWPYTASGVGTRIVEVAGYGSTGNYHSVISNGGAGGQPTSVTVTSSGGNLNLAINYNSLYRWNASAKVVYGANGMTMSVDGTNG